MAHSRMSVRVRALCAIVAVSAAALIWSWPAGAATVAQERIVSLAPSVTETLFALGAGSKVVGVSQYCNYPPAVRQLPRVGSYLTPNIEAIVGLRPTLIIGLGSSANLRAIRALEMMGLPTLMVEEGSLADLDRSISQIGKRIGSGAQAAKLIAEIHYRFASTEARLKNADSPKVLMLVGHQPLVAVGGGNFLDQLIAMAHGRNIADNSAQVWPRLSIEYVVATAPDVIIDGQMGDDPAVPSNFWGQYPGIPAVRNHRLYGYNQDPILLPGPRIGQSLEILTAMIHPELANSKPQSEAIR